MRNTTKLKAILLKYTVSFDMNDDEIFSMMLVNKSNGMGQEFQAKTYSTVIAKAYSYMMSQLRKEESDNSPG